ncbi:DEKNAAC101913 [Brettanomyces naardenensis]|uniref:DEKNAAC101913 n=1 Tax=Brettanomyces naardenensis TaxID=13370 RepID=A0A448YJ13_BRENA|nr:DEKNAAC101913 [Brettanomyces naardenensis]
MAMAAFVVAGVAVSGSTTTRGVFNGGARHTDPQIDQGNGDQLSLSLVVLLGMGSGFFIIIILTSVILLVQMLIHRAHIRLTNETPGSLDDAAHEQEQDRRALDELPPNEQELYFQAKDFIKLNPAIKYDLTLSQSLIIQEKGVKAWEFKPDVENVDAIRVVNKTELEFLNEGQELSIQTNFPIPKQNDVYYFETKIYELAVPESSSSHVVSIGISSFPYPYFRLPGRHRWSICYDSNGSRRYNQPFPLSVPTGLCVFPTLEQGDVVGCGIRTRNRTIFWTRNGKKLSESSIGGHIKMPKEFQLYPTIGSNSMCKVQVNLGQMGYVFIEANVKKWGFGPLEGNEVAPPLYTKFNKDVLLESSDLDPADLNLRNGDFPPGFYDSVATPAQFTDNDSDDEITLQTMQEDRQGFFEGKSSGNSSPIQSVPPPVHPPSYVDVLEQEQTEAVDATNDVIRQEGSSNGGK